MSSLRQFAALLLALSAVLFCLADVASAAKIRHGQDPSIMHVGDTYWSVESAGGIYIREASSLEGLGAADVRRERVWEDKNNLGDVWAPEITTDGGRVYIHFAAGSGGKHRMYVISADEPFGKWSEETKLDLDGDQWAIDGTYFVFEGQGWFVWSGWKDEATKAEQNLYICKMTSPSQPSGPRYIISQPRESWEKGQRGDMTFVNEGPEAIIDPDGQLHIVYSANGSWSNKYCLADLRLRKGGNPEYVWDWYKSNGCLFGSEQSRMMKGWDATKFIDGPGHHTFAHWGGDINKSPVGTNHIPFVFHGVEKGTEYKWENRDWFTGSFVWWSKTTYSRKSVPGDKSNEGYSFKFFE